MNKQQAPQLDVEHIRRLARLALNEDAADRDVTTSTLVPPELQGSATIIAKAAGVVAGLPVAAAVFHEIDPSLRFQPLVSDGDRVAVGNNLATVEGTVASILQGERVALNFLQRLSGIATATAGFVDAVAGTGARILDTRKTTPGLRALEKYAVRMGGGQNHRFDLSDGILVKDNHWQALRAQGVDIAEAVRRLRGSTPGMKIEVEVTSATEAREALAAGVDMLLLDNMSLEETRRVVSMARGRALTEASGGITLETVRPVAETGVDFISVGALTHSAHALDISLELQPASRYS